MIAAAPDERSARTLESAMRAAVSEAVHARAATLTLLVGSLGCVLLLHLLHRDLNPVERRLSEYANGPYGALMLLTFVAMGLGLLLLAWQLRPASGVPRFVAPLLGLAGAGLLLSGGFPTGSGSPLIEIVHSRASAAAVLALTAAAVLAATGQAGPQQSAVRIIAGVAVTAVVVSPLLHDTRWSGLGQRLVWFSLATWLVMTAWERWRVVTLR